MPLKLDYICRSCGCTVSWVYDEDGLHPSGITGCPGKNCRATHELIVCERKEEEGESEKDRVRD